jgi:hypothetical protein
MAAELPVGDERPVTVESLVDRRVIGVEVKARERRNIGHLLSSSNAERGAEGRRGAVDSTVLGH